MTDEYRAAMRAVSDKLGLFGKRKASEGSPYDIGREGLSFLTSCYEVFEKRNPELRTMLTEHYRRRRRAAVPYSDMLVRGRLSRRDVASRRARRRRPEQEDALHVRQPQAAGDPA